MRILRFETLILFVILLFSLIFRVTNLNLIEFKTDEAVNLILSALPILHSSLPAGGTVSSVGILNPPFFNYLLTPLAFFTLDPKIFSFFIGFLNSISIVFFYLIVKKYYGQIVAFTSSILFALSPWAIIYSRKIWEQDILIPFFIVFFYSSHKLVREKKEIFWFPLIFSSLFLIQLHQAVILFVSMVIIFIILGKPKLNYKYILLGLVLGILPLFPYLGYELKYGFPDFKAIFSQNRLGNERSLKLFIRPLEITGQGYITFELGPDLDTLIKNYPFINEVRTLFYFEYILIIFGAFLYFKNFKQFRFLFIPTFLIPLLYFILKIEPFMHYYIIILPILFIFLGFAFENLFQKKSLLKFGGIGLFLLLVICSIYFDFSFFDLLRKQGHLGGDYGSALTSSESRIIHKKYDETFLYQFLPLGYYFGYNPFAKMIYGDISPKTIPSLEQQLESGDNQAKNELLAYYTKEVPKLQTIDILKKKQGDIPQYSDIYKIVLEDYMARNYKKQYLSDKFNYTFFYPEHWKVNERQNIIIEGDYLKATIQREKPNSNFKEQAKTNFSALGENGEKIKCKKNCGAYYLFNSFNVVIESKGDNEKGLNNEINAFEELLKSLRYISQ